MPGSMCCFRIASGFSAATCFDLHAARGGCHEDRLAFGAVNKDSQIKFFLDGQRLFDKQPAHDAPLGTGLVGDQFHAEHLAGQLTGFVHRLGDLDAAALPRPPA